MSVNSLATQELKERLHSLPAWAGQEDFTAQTWAQYIDVARIVQSTDPDTVEAALNGFIQEALQEQFQEYESESKPFILMRVVFEIPEVASAEKRFSYKGWTNWPDPDAKNQVNLSWPVSWEGGAPKLLASYEGSMGQPYAAAAEYSFLSQNFPYRNL
jgi:hypothetical protein